MTTQAALALVSRPAPVPTGRARCIALTGHRAPGLQPGAAEAIREAICQLVIQHPGVLWLAGGATGADMIATSELLDQGQQVRLILPFVPAIQARRWALQQRRMLLDHVARASGVEVVAEHYSVAAYHERNRRLVQQADLLVAFYDGRRRHLPDHPAGGESSSSRDGLVDLNQLNVAGEKKVWHPPRIGRHEAGSRGLFSSKSMAPVPHLPNLEARRMAQNRSDLPNLNAE